MVNECIALMSGADGIILGSPTYFADLTPELKALIGLGLHEKDVDNDAEGIQIMRTLGQNMGWLMKKICN
ncbi:MAG: NAD(P)H-dependent oxidoreductase [Methanothrix sp.]|nr:NAD(P)H-dependent oxidoreductase [Methanothrix sp.]